jgi:iron complex transport system substrate-binding protein
MKQKVLFVSILVVALLVGCAAPSMAPQAAMREAAATTAAAYPITIENCGNTLTFAKAPERVLATYQNVAEILVALGLTDKIVGVTYGQAYDPLPEMAEAVNGLNWLSPRGQGSAGKEVTLSTQPDFVFSAYPTYDFNASKGMATQEEFVAAGAPVYGISAECTAQVPEGTIESVYNDILNIGRIMGVEARAVALVQQMRDQIAAVQQRVTDQPQLPVAFYDTGEDLLGMYGSGLNADMIKLAGGQNVFGDQPEVYLQVSKEAFAVTNPEIFAIIDYEGNPAVPEEAARAEYLFTTFPNLPASQNRRYVAVPGSAFAAGVRISIAIETMARAFHPAAFATTPASSTTYPVTIENCGNTLTFDKAPERVASLYSVTTELLLRLGLADHIVAAANFGEPLPDDLQAAYQGLNLVGEGFIIPKEVLLSQKPDLVMDNQPDWFYSAENGFATVEEITGSGAQIYSITAKCGGGQVDATFDDIYTDIRNMGKIFGVSNQAEALITEMQATVDAVTAKVAGQAPLQVMIYDAGEGPLGVFGPGSYDAILRLVGGENAFADLTESYAQVSIEAVASRQIDVVIVGGYDETGETRADFIRQTFPNMAAVKNDRVVVIEYGLMNPGVRNHLGVEAFAKALYPEAFE